MYTSCGHPKVSDVSDEATVPTCCLVIAEDVCNGPTESSDTDET